VNVSGVVGSGRDAGAGGPLIALGTLPSNGIFGSTASSSTTLLGGDSIASAPNGGRTISCAKGNYWRNRGYSACQNIGSVQFYRSDGSVVSNTATISRGFKAGYSILTTSGAGSGNGGNGGGGVTGGNGGTGGGGGGGGSGYSDGSVTIVTTQQGGNSGIAQIVIKPKLSSTLPALASIFYTSTILSVKSGSGTVGSSSGFTGGSGTGTNGFRYNAPTGNYFMELQITNNNWNNSYGFVGVSDDTHWNNLNWTSTQGARLMYYIGNNFSYGEQTGSSQTGTNFNQSLTSGDILGIVVNSESGKVAFYKNGVYFVTISNSRAIGRSLYVTVSDWYFKSSLTCNALSSYSQYAINYALP
jgi:hypothetical protein